jgi:hypothetical protein
MNNHEHQEGLDFVQSIDHNLHWIKQLAVEHDVSQGMIASATLMTMTMIDHHRFNMILSKINSDLEIIRTAVCQSNSSPVPTKPQ